jgi:hypothetical protein
MYNHLEAAELANSFYYTFNTIPQVVTTMIGLLGAFSLFNIQLLDTELFNTANVLFTYYMESNLKLPSPTLLETKNFTEFLSYIKSHPKPTNIHFEPRFERFEILLSRKIKLVKDLKYSLLLTSVIVIISIIFLMLTPDLTRLETTVNWIDSACFGVGIVGVMFCLRSYYMLIINSLDK